MLSTALKSGEGKNNELLRERLESFGLTKKQAADMLSVHDEVYILENLAMVERCLDEGKIKVINLARYTYSALRDDYRPKGLPSRASNSSRQPDHGLP